MICMGSNATRIPIMSVKVFRDRDADPSRLDKVAVAIIGYGNQGHAHALNLRDSGIHVMVGQRAGPGLERAKSDGFEPISMAKAASQAELILLTLPDESAAVVFDQDIKPHLRPGKTLGFVHGFNIHFGFIDPPDGVDVIMIAPKGPGTLLRSLFEEDKGLPALLAIHRDCSGNALQMALAWATRIGSMRASVIMTTFASETESDLFGEQAVLCGGVAALTKAAFEILVDAGYEPEFAYLECVHELKQTVDLLYEHGLAGMRQRISNTAEYGDLTRGSRIIDDAVRENMKQVLEEIRSGAFAKEWMEEVRSGAERFKALIAADEDTAYERAGKTVRSFMPWLKEASNRERHKNHDRQG